MKAGFFITFLATLLLVNLGYGKPHEDHSEAFYFKESDKARFGQKTTMSIMMNILNASLKKPEPKKEAITKAETTDKPKVKQFAGDIYKNEYFTNSVYHTYFQAFWEGYRMTSYQMAPECEADFSEFMDVFHEFHLNMTRRRTDDKIEKWYDPYRLIVYTIGEQFNDFWYNCFRFGYDVYDTYATKFDNFVDFGDIYLSFIFNMLANSVTIREDVEGMIEAFDTHDTESFVRDLGSILRAVLEFESYQAAGSITDNPIELAFVKSVKQPTKEQRAAKVEKQMKEAEARLNAQRKTENREWKKGAQERLAAGVHPLVALQPEDYEWSVVEYIEIPFALLIGAMHALPQDSYGYKCS